MIVTRYVREGDRLFAIGTPEHPVALDHLIASKLCGAGFATIDVFAHALNLHVAALRGLGYRSNCSNGRIRMTSKPTGRQLATIGFPSLKRADECRNAHV